MARPTLEQEGEHISWDRRAEAGCPADDVELVCIAGPMHVAAGIEERADDLDSACSAGEVQRVGIVSGIARIGIRAVLEEQSHRVEVRDSEVQAGAAFGISLTHESRLTGQHLAKGRDISRSTGREECRERGRAASVDLRFERAPAWEAIVMSNGELRGGKLRLRIAPPHFEEALFRALLQELEGRAIWQLMFRHNTPPSVDARRPRSRAGR